MKRSVVRGALACLVAVSSGAGVGCSAIPVQMHTTTHIQHADGTVEHKETHWKGTLDELPSQLGKAGEDLGQVTAKMAKELTDVPPPGKVKLSDLHPSLKKNEGKDGQDFLIAAKNKDGTPIDFTYVRLGAPSYDDFFKTAQEIYAICWQTQQTVHRLREQASAVLNTKVDASQAVKGQVDQALGAPGADPAIVTEMKSLNEMAQSLGLLVSQLSGKMGKLVSTGQALVAGAASSLTNPKVVTHLDLVKEGLTDSIGVIKQSAFLVVALGQDLAGYS